MRQLKSKVGRGRKPAEGPCQTLKVTVKDTNHRWSKSRRALSDIETGIPAGQSPGHGAVVISKFNEFLIEDRENFSSLCPDTVGPAVTASG